MLQTLKPGLQPLPTGPHGPPLCSLFSRTDLQIPENHPRSIWCCAGLSPSPARQRAEESMGGQGQAPAMQLGLLRLTATCLLSRSPLSPNPLVPPHAFITKRACPSPFCCGRHHDQPGTGASTRPPQAQSKSPMGDTHIHTHTHTHTRAGPLCLQLVP